MTSGRTHPNYTVVWLWLLALLAVGLGASLLPGGRAVALAVIFATAFVKALLVALNFMHLRFESGLIYAIALIPLVFAAILAVALFPDFVWHALGR
jgi:caa(3)-type oxidase subunit IV